MNTNDNNMNERKMSRDELSSAYEDLLRNFSESSSSSKPSATSAGAAAQPRRTQPARTSEKTEPTARQGVAKTKPVASSSVKRTAPAPKAQSTAAAYSEQLAQESAVRKTAAKKKPAASAQTKSKSSPSAKTTTANKSTASAKKKKKLRYKEKKRQYRKQRWAHGLLSLFVSVMLIVIIFLTSSALKVPLLGFVNDVIAIDRSDAPVAVYISADMKTDQILDMLESYDLIYSASFCKLLMGFFGYTDESQYIEGEHVLSADMGVEGMLDSMLFNSDGDATVKVTFPEGYTIDQIAERLYNEKVISAKNAFYNAIATYEFPEEFDFLNTITDAQLRYRILEGYLYPDTYEFYVGENVNSVLNRFLSNFSNKWIDEYADAAEDLGYTVDEIITIASILQKEAHDANQMFTIASILYNRLDSNSLTILQCDSTQDYIARIDDGLLNQSELTALLARYDTYQRDGLPVGPICNPGGDAIYAALHPDSTDYYYFCHDSEGQIYCARTLDEHSINVQNYVD